MPDRDTYTEVGVSPKIVGLGQDALINIMTYPGPSGPTYEAQSLVEGLLGGFSNISITVTKPNGQTETFMPIDETLERAGIVVPGQAEIVGHLQFYYKPDQIGTYSFTASFPGKTYTTDNQYANFDYSVYYKPSESTQIATLTVVEDQQLAGLLNGYPWSPLPNDYWQNPVSTNNREWYEISGDWVQSRYNILGSNYNPYSTAPTSSHILWANQVSLGGLVGGMWGSLPYAGGGGAGGIVLDGKIYQAGKSGYFDCVDLRTGKLLWSAPGSINGAQRYYPTYQTGGQTNEGAISAWLWSGISGSNTGTGATNWLQYNPYNGDLTRNITNVPRDIMYTKYEDGSPIFWCVQGNLALFNTSVPMKLPYLNLIKWDLSQLTNTVGYSQVNTNNWTQGVVWNVTIMQDDQVSIGDNNFQGVKPFPYDEAGVVIVRSRNAIQTMAGYDMETGAFLWKNNATVLNIDVRDEGIATSPAGPMIMADGASNNFVAYDVKTGRELWRAPSGELPWGMLPAYTFVHHNGVTFMGSYDGHVYAYNVTNGNLVWKSEYIGADDETIYGNQPYTGSAVGANGILYYSTATVYSLMPRTRFHEIVAINETTGQFLWKLPIGMNPTAVVNGYLIATNSENGMQYGIGKGQTQTTITAPLTTVAAGTSVLIQGSVFDMSPGAPNTPAVSDANMDEWMDYLYGQNATLINNPPAPEGVSIRLTAIDQNGNPTDLGTVTSDSSGLYKTMWTPDNEGAYTIYATFDGSNSYWGSYATTALGVAQADKTTNYTWIIIGASIAIIVAVVLATIIVLKKKP
ncbi:MAG: PQQ-binding-like beta-propeller repeat protein [Nitrososphaerota archaeon]|nr:PQQ-binding-like beta-propeller repeat protein [Nitrososphaerota archaeon]